MNLRVNSDLWAGFLGLVFAAGFWFSMGRLSTLSAVFPETILLLTAVISVALLVKGALKPDMRVLFEEGNRLRLVVTTVILFAWWWGIGILGFAVSSAIAFFLLVCYLAAVQRPVTWKLAGIWACVVVAEVAFFYIVFNKLLYVRPPRGLLF
ncbi:tripartite tricarboxylate transporter TctB family protein [Aquibaculum sediminis]|uniref:tripartite tricarboxylate transporter TctB family protein n=1 Tax=Aquibaculum sediminis TaxID=3231907 RepID=UPI003451F080